MKRPLILLFEGYSIFNHVEVYRNHPWLGVSLWIWKLLFEKRQIGFTHWRRVSKTGTLTWVCINPAEIVCKNWKRPIFNHFSKRKYVPSFSSTMFSVCTEMKRSNQRKQNQLCHILYVYSSQKVREAVLSLLLV